MRWYDLTGGLIAAFYVFALAYGVPQVGVALVMIAIVAGQTGNALLVDRMGLGGGAPTPLHPGRIAAAVLALVGVVVATNGRGQEIDFALLPVLLALLAGGLGCFQMAMMARINRATGNPVAAAGVNNGMAAVGMGVALLIMLALGQIEIPWPVDVPWWAWIGGAVSIGPVAVTGWATHRIGVLMFVLALLIGQLTAALFLDLLAPTAPVQIGLMVVVGVVITFIAAAMGALFSRPKATVAPPGAEGVAE